MPNVKPAISFIGFGEAGQAIAAGLREAGVDRMSAWDILFPQRGGEQLRQAGEASGVRCAGSAADAVREADLVISAVTAASSVDAALSVKPHLASKPFFLDINSVSPGRKQQTAKLLGEAARYVDVAVIAPIHPARHQTPMLLAGPACRGRRAYARRARHACQHRRSRNRRGGGDQDGAQRDDQGHRGADAGVFSGRGARRCDRRGRRIDEEQLSRSRLGKDRALQSRTHGKPWRTARRRNGRSRRYACANSASSR